MLAVRHERRGSGHQMVNRAGGAQRRRSGRGGVLRTCLRPSAIARRVRLDGPHGPAHGGRSAAGFGIAAWHDGGKADPYLSVKGVRGIASGLIAVILPGAAIIVLRSNGPKATVYGVHGATVVVLLATAALLFTYVARLE